MKLKTYIENYCHYEWSIIKSTDDSALIATSNAVKWWGDKEIFSIDFDNINHHNIITLG